MVMSTRPNCPACNLMTLTGWLNRNGQDEEGNNTYRITCENLECGAIVIMDDSHKIIEGFVIEKGEDNGKQI